MQLTNAQWDIIKPFVQKKYTTGRPRVNDRRILNGILWILRTGAPWKELPSKYPSYQTCHRRFHEWSRSGVFDDILAVLAQDLEKRGKISLEECFIDGTFAGAKKGVSALVPQNVGKVPKSWQLQTKTLFQSPFLWKVLLDMKSLWWKKRLNNDLRKVLRKGLLETKRMIVTPTIYY